MTIWQISRHVIDGEGGTRIEPVETVEGDVAAVNARLEALIAEHADAVFSAGAAPDPDAPPPLTIPNSVTASDWRVALVYWGRLDEIEAKVIAARDSGTLQGKVIWQRWEYANHVYRSELMELRDAFGFSEAEVDESLMRAQAVAQASGG